MRDWTMLITAKRTVTAATLAILLACSDRTPTVGTPPIIPPASPGNRLDTFAIVSAPTPTSVSVSSQRRSVFARAGAVDMATAGTVVYVSLPPNTVSAGLSAKIANLATGDSVIARMIDGGFDPVAIAAQAGDSLSIEVRAATSLLFTRLSVPRTRPPIIVRTSPPNGATDVPLNTRLAVVFSEPMDPSTITSIQLLQADQSVGGSASLDPLGLVAVFSPASALSANSQYTLTVTTSARGLDGTPIDHSASVDFTTAVGPLDVPLTVSAPSPQLVYVSVPPGAIPDGLSATISNLATGESITAVVVNGGFDPLSIAANVGNTLKIDARTTRGLYSTTIVVPAASSPSIVRTNPVDGSTDVALNLPFTVVFSEPVASTSLGGSVRLFENGAEVGVFTMLKPPGLVAEFPAAVPTANTDYRLDVSSSISNLAGSHISQTTSVSFRTGNQLLPGAAPRGRIAFISNQDGKPQLYVVNADGSGLAQLTHDTLTYSALAWSPDATRIAVERSDGLVVMNADGTGVQLVATVGGGTPAWSADGMWIRFGSPEIREVSADGSQIRTLCTLAVSPAGGPTGGRGLVWSPDLHKAALEVESQLNGDGLTQLYMTDDQCSPVHRLTWAADAVQAAEGSPAWSRDGQNVAFWSAARRGPTVAGNVQISNGIWAGNPEGSWNSLAETPIYVDIGGNTTVMFQSALSWSPDGQLLAIVRSVSNVFEISVGPADGTGIPRHSIFAAAPGAQITQLAWSPR